MSLGKTLNQDIMRVGGGPLQAFWRLSGQAWAPGFPRALKQFTRRLQPANWLTILIERRMFTRTPYIIAISNAVGRAPPRFCRNSACCGILNHPGPLPTVSWQPGRTRPSIPLPLPKTWGWKHSWMWWKKPSRKNGKARRNRTDVLGMRSIPGARRERAAGAETRIRAEKNLPGSPIHRALPEPGALRPEHP